MPKHRHRAEATLTNIELPKASIKIIARCDGKRLGELTVGAGGVYWRETNKRSGKNFSWSKFRDFIRRG